MNKRGFTLIEMTAVLAALGVLAAMALPSLGAVVRGHQASANARAVVMTLTEARALAQRENKPVEVALFSNRIVIRLSTLSGEPEALRRTVSSYEVWRTVPLDDIAIRSVRTTAPTATRTTTTASSAAVIRICASSDNYIRNADLTPVCGPGSLASQEADINLVSRDVQNHVHISQPMAAILLQAGSV